MGMTGLVQKRPRGLDVPALGCDAITEATSLPTRRFRQQLSGAMSSVVFVLIGQVDDLVALLPQGVDQSSSAAALKCLVRSLAIFECVSGGIFEVSQFVGQSSPLHGDFSLIEKLPYAGEVPKDRVTPPSLRNGPSLRGRVSAPF
jgi:hypothetical protein